MSGMSNRDAQTQREGVNGSFARSNRARGGAGTAAKKLRDARGLGFGYPPLDVVKLAKVDRFALWSGSEFVQVS